MNFFPLYNRLGLQFVFSIVIVIFLAKIGSLESQGLISHCLAATNAAGSCSSCFGNVLQDEQKSTVELAAVRNDLEAAWDRMLQDIGRTQDTTLPVERFMGYVEGRLGIRIPESWQHRFRAAEFHPKDVIRFTSGHSPFVKASDDLVVRVSSSFRIDRIDEQWHLVSKDIKIPLIGFDDETNSFRVGDIDTYCYEMAIGRADANSAIVAFCSDSPCSYSLVRLGASGEILWASTVECQSPPLKSRVSMPSVTAEIVVKGSCVIIFGVSRGVVYLEGFDLESGENLYRFSNTREIVTK
jgi:hypothetical protein